MGTTRQAEPSARVVLQRVRNRILEYLELISSFEAQQEYQARVPFAVVPELINQWEDWVVDGWEASYVWPVFSDEERTQIAEFGKVWSDVAERLPASLPSLAEVQRTDDWLRLCDSAARARRVFDRRGRLYEHDDGADGGGT